MNADGSNYTDEELQLLRAMQQWMRLNKTAYPKFTDVLAVLISLGYRQVEAKQPLPYRPRMICG